MLLSAAFAENLSLFSSLLQPWNHQTHRSLCDCGARATRQSLDELNRCCVGFRGFLWTKILLVSSKHLLTHPRPLQSSVGRPLASTFKTPYNLHNATH